MKVSGILFLVLCLDFQSNGQTYDSIATPLEQDSAYVNGQITLSNEKPQAIMFAIWDHWLGIQRVEYAMLDEEGKFEIQFFIRNTNPVFWQYNNNSRHNGFLIVSPGDSLTMLVNGTEVTFSGKNAAASEDYYHIRTPKERSAYYHALDTGYRLEPEAYLEFRKGHYEEDLEFLQNYCNTRNCSELFREYYAADLKVRYFMDLMNYSWKSADYGLGSPVRLTGERKEKYDAAYLNDIDLDDPIYAMSFYYTPFLNAYSQKAEKRIPFDQVEKVVYIIKLNHLLDIISKEVSLELNETSSEKRILENLLKKAHSDSVPDSADVKVMWKLSEQYELPLQRAMDMWNADRWVETLKSVPHQKTRELNIVHTFIRFMDTHPNLDYFYQGIYPLIKNKEFRDILSREYNRKKEEEALIGNNHRGIQVIPKNYGKSANQVLSDIVKANRNKVILIDFWATWCGPCLEDFKAVKPLKEKLPSDSVRYVYICSQSNSDNWAKQIKKYNVQGQHYFISETQYSEFQKRFGLKGFPSYIVVDAKKRIYKDISMSDIRNEKLFLNKLKQIMANDD